jgi:hypothetical protein
LITHENNGELPVPVAEAVIFTEVPEQILSALEEMVIEVFIV